MEGESMNKDRVPEVGCGCVVLALAFTLGVLAAMMGPGTAGYFMDPVPNMLFRMAVLVLIFGFPMALIGVPLVRWMITDVSHSQH